jgi:hypothetical protein
MAGSATAAAAAIGHDTGNDIVHGGLHQGSPHDGLDDVFGPVVFDKHYLGHEFQELLV